MKKVFLVILTTLFCISMFAQQAISTAGGNASGSGGTVSYTVGQVVYTTSTGSNGSAVQGVQQPYEISVVTSMQEAVDISLQWSAYPNPTSDNLTLSIQNADNSELDTYNLSYKLYDTNGKLLLNNKFDGPESTISMGNLSAGTYILKIIEKNGNKSQIELKTFIIIKH